MTISIKHNFHSAKSDGADSTLVQPSNWNDEHVITLATSSVMGRKTAGTGAVEELTANDVYTVLGIVAGTQMLFGNSAAPTGWTKLVDLNDYALRVVSGVPGTGGLSPFSTVFGKTATDSHTLTAAEMPSHDHSFSGSGYTSFDGSHSHTYTYYPTAKPQGSSGSTVASVSGSSTSTSSDGSHQHFYSFSGTTGSAGSDGGHTHGMDIRVQYVDVIRAQKS